MRFFDFRAGNVFGIFEIKPKIKFPHPPLHYRHIPFFGIKQNEFVDVPSEEKFCSGIGCLVKGVTH